MRYVVRHLLFSFLALISITHFYTGFRLRGGYPVIFFAVAVGFGVINILARPMLKLMGLSASGMGYLVLNTFINLIAFFVFDRFFGLITITSGQFVNLNILNFLLSSYNLTLFWSYVAVSFWFSFVMWFQSWLYGGKKKRSE